MTSPADRAISAISAIRSEHDALAELVPTLSDAQLTGPSGAGEWSVAQVLSHLGSGGEITLAGLQAALGERETPGEDFNPSVWARWDAMSPTEQRDAFLEHGAALVTALEALDAEQQESLQIKVGFLPMPLPVAAFAGMRLNETAAHGWDVRVAVDPAAELLTGSAQVLAELLSGPIGFLLGFIGKADQLATPAVVDIAGSGYAISVADSTAVVASDGTSTATFEGGLEPAVRLLTGRLRAERTPAAVTVTGNVTLDQLRAVFPGF